MLIIRQEQIDHFIKGSDEEFIEFLLKHIKGEHPELKSKHKDETLREMIRGGIERAKTHDFSTAEDLTAFVSVMFEIAPNFDEQPEIKAIVDDENTPPNQRLDKLWTPVFPKEAWEEAENNYDENAWFPERMKNETSGN